MNLQELIDNARARFDAARDALGTSRSMEISAALTDLEDAYRSSYNAAQRIDGDANLSAQGKRTKRADIRRKYEATAQAIAKRIHELVNASETDHRDRLRVPEPDGPNAAMRMLIARTDAQMVLDRTPSNELGAVMRALATDPGDVGRLMLGDWSSRYLQARRDNVAAADFIATRDELAAQWRGEAGAAGLAGLRAMPEARRATELATFAARTGADAIGPADLAPAPDAAAWPSQGEHSARAGWSDAGGDAGGAEGG